MDTIRVKYAILQDILESGNMRSFSAAMYSAGLIGPRVMETDDYRKVIKEFEAGLDLKLSVLELIDCYSKFLEILTRLGGSAALISQEMEIDWLGLGS